MFVKSQNVKLFAITPFHRFSRYNETSGCWQVLKGSLLLCVPTLPVFVHYNWYILKNFGLRDLVWGIAISEFVV